MFLRFSNLNIIISLFAIVAALYSGPLIVGAEESQDDLKSIPAVSHLLDGKKFIGPTGEKGKKTHHEDVLSFSDGRFTSSKCFEFGFTDSPYTTTIEGGLIHFQAETVSPTHGKMMWKGTLADDIMEVEYSWTKERWLWTTYREYWFRGTLQK